MTPDHEAAKRYREKHDPYPNSAEDNLSLAYLDLARKVEAWGPIVRTMRAAHTAGGVGMEGRDVTGERPCNAAMRDARDRFVMLCIDAANSAKALPEDLKP